MINDFYVANPDRTPSLLDSFPISKSGFVTYVNSAVLDSYIFMFLTPFIILYRRS